MAAYSINTNNPDMNLEKIYQISQTLGVIAILVSLVLLVDQGREAQEQTEQANKIAQAQLSHTSTAYFVELYLGFEDTAEDTAFMQKAFYTMEPLSEHEQSKYLSRMQALLSIAIASHDLVTTGLMSESTYARGTAFMQYILIRPRQQKWWSVQRNSSTIPSGLRETFDQTVAQASSIEQVNPLVWFDVNTALPVEVKNQTSATNN